MKSSIPYILMLIVLFAGTIAGYMIEDDIEKDKTDIKDEQIDSLKVELKELKKVDESTIIITDTVLVVWSNFDIKNNAYQHPNTRSLHDGKNKHDFTINDSTRVEIIIIKN